MWFAVEELFTYSHFTVSHTFPSKTTRWKPGMCYQFCENSFPSWCFWWKGILWVIQIVKMNVALALLTIYKTIYAICCRKLFTYSHFTVSRTFPPKTTRWQVSVIHFVKTVFHLLVLGGKVFLWVIQTVNINVSLAFFSLFFLPLTTILSFKKKKGEKWDKLFRTAVSWTSSLLVRSTIDVRAASRISLCASTMEDVVMSLDSPRCEIDS